MSSVDYDVDEKQKNIEKTISFFSSIIRYAKDKFDVFREWLPNETIRTTSNSRQYSKSTILSYMQNPSQNSANLINASNYFYSTILLYSRICRYLSEMPTYDYIVSPVGTDFPTSKQGINKYRKAYFNIISMLDTMNIKKNFSDIARTCVREGCFYGIEISSKNSYAIYQFPHTYCAIIGIEDNVPMYKLDLTYFDTRKTLLSSIGGEIEKAYNDYKAGKSDGKWYEVSSDISICVRFDPSVPYIVPPLSGCFNDLFVLDEFQELVAEQNYAELYKLLNLELPLNDDGTLAIDDKIATNFYNQIASQLPSSVGLAMSPFPLSAINFDKSTVDRDLTSKATRDMFSNIGISQMIFNNDVGSTTALSKSIENDFSFMLPVLRGLEAWLNRKLKKQSGTIKFKVIFPDVSIYNRASFADSIRKDMQYGIPSKGLLAAVNYGYTPLDLYGVNYLETEVLRYQDTFIPPQSANTQSSSEGGRPNAGDNVEDEAQAARDGS